MATRFVDCPYCSHERFRDQESWKCIMCRDHESISVGSVNLVPLSEPGEFRAFPSDDETMNAFIFSLPKGWDYWWNDIRHITVDDGSVSDLSALAERFGGRILDPGAA